MARWDRQTLFVRSGWGIFLALKLPRGGGVAFLQDAVVGQT